MINLKIIILLGLVLIGGCSTQQSPTQIESAPPVHNEGIEPEGPVDELPFELQQIEYLGSTAFKIKDKFGGNVIYINPYQLSEDAEKADIILITNPLERRCSIKDVLRILKENTTIVTTPDCNLDLQNRIITVRPGDIKIVNGVVIIPTPAYSDEYPAENEWLGFFLKANRLFYYHAGDTGFIPAMKQLGEVHVAMLPIGGKGTMDIDEAIDATYAIDASYSVPMDYLDLKNADELEKRWVEEVEFGFPYILR